MELAPAYVRCRDLSGDLWTVPRGSRLHLLLWSDVQQGYPEPFVPIALIREPWRGLEWDMEDALRSAVAVVSSPFIQSAARTLAAHNAFRLGQFRRLQERVKVRTSTNGNA